MSHGHGGHLGGTRCSRTLGLRIPKRPILSTRTSGHSIQFAEGAGAGRVMRLERGGGWLCWLFCLGRLARPRLGGGGILEGLVGGLLVDPLGLHECPSVI